MPFLSRLGAGAMLQGNENRTSCFWRKDEMMTPLEDRARQMLTRWKGSGYRFGLGAGEQIGAVAAEAGSRALVAVSGLGADWAHEIHATVREQLAQAGVRIVGDLVAGARPNSPRDDVARLVGVMADRDHDMVLSVGGGSGIDAVKAANACSALGGFERLDELFGTGQVSEGLDSSEAHLTPMVAVQLASGSAAHLTRYANVTDLEAGQKMLMVDDALVPDRAVFDYAWTRTMSPEFTMDGALDGVSHCWEVLMGASGDRLAQVRPVCLAGIELIAGNLKRAVADGSDLPARQSLGLGTDLGGYAIMMGGTSGAHLNSFSLVDVLAHGRACALMNPYWTVCFAEAIQPQLRDLARVYRRCGYLSDQTDGLAGRALGRAVAEGMLELSRDIGFPTRLSQVEGFGEAHVRRALGAARSPKLRMKLRNMPIPLEPDQVDRCMGSVLQAATEGDFDRIETP
jgi:alcohol dehydrogenase